MFHTFLRRLNLKFLLDYLKLNSASPSLRLSSVIERDRFVLMSASHIPFGTFLPMSAASDASVEESKIERDSYLIVQHPQFLHWSWDLVSKSWARFTTYLN